MPAHVEDHGVERNPLLAESGDDRLVILVGVIPPAAVNQSQRPFGEHRDFAGDREEIGEGPAVVRAVAQHVELLVGLPLAEEVQLVLGVLEHGVSAAAQDAVLRGGANVVRRGDVVLFGVAFLAVAVVQRPDHAAEVLRILGAQFVDRRDAFDADAARGEGLRRVVDYCDFAGRDAVGRTLPGDVERYGSRGQSGDSQVGAYGCEAVIVTFAHGEHRGREHLDSRLAERYGVSGAAVFFGCDRRQGRQQRSCQ